MTIDEMYKKLFTKTAYGYTNNYSRGYLYREQKISFTRGYGNHAHKVHGLFVDISILSKDIDSDILWGVYGHQKTHPRYFNKFRLFEDGTVHEEEESFFDTLANQKEPVQDKIMIGLFCKF